MTKDEFFKMRDEQRAQGLLQEYIAPTIENNLTQEQEQRLLKALNGQNRGIYRTTSVQLEALKTVIIYNGQKIQCQRKRIDEIDNITVWKKEE